MLKSFLSLFLSLLCLIGFSQTTGDVAFVGFNADGDDNFAIVALSDLSAGTTIYFTDKEPDATGALTTGEGIVSWNTGASVISAGTVITFTDVSSSTSLTSSLGTLTDGAGSFNLAAGGDALFAYTGSDENTPIDFLAGIQNSAGNEGDLNGTQLSSGSTFITFASSGDPDGGYYSGDRDTETAFVDYLALIADPANWTTNSLDGEALLPFPTNTFIIVGGQEVGFDLPDSEVNETDATFSVTIDVTLSNYAGTQVDLSVTIDGASTADPTDYTLNTSSLSFNSSATQSVSLSINDDADFNNETIVLNISETTSTGIAITEPQHTISIIDDDTPDIVITEIMYNSNDANGSDDEWIEIYNNDGSSADVSDWTISVGGSVLYTFPSSTTLSSSTYYTIAFGSNGDGTFNNDNPFEPDFNSLGLADNADVATIDDSNNLTNSTRSIELKTAGGTTVTEITYDNSVIPLTDGDGPSLSLADVSLDNSTLDNWVASIAFGGTPGATNDVTMWTGAVDSELITTGNWTNGSPNSALSVYIPASTVIPLVNDDISAGALRIGSGQSLIVQNGTLTVEGEILNDGFFEVFSGASLIPLGTVTGAGSFTIMRNTTFSTNEGQYSIVGSPIMDGSTSSLGSVVYKYNESISYNGTGNDRFIEVTSPETMSPGDGYFSAFTGSISFTGTLNTGTVSQSLVYDEVMDGSASDAGYNLVANPYTAAIDVDELVFANADISASIYLWQDESSHTTQGSNNDYVIYNSTLNTSTRNTPGGIDFDGFVRSGQGFFVKSTAASTLSFTPDMMVTGNNSDGGFYRKGMEEDIIRISLNDEADRYSDLLLAVREDASLNIDRRYDAFRMGGATFNFYSKVNQERLAIQGIPPIAKELTIPLGFNAMETGEMSIKIEEGSLRGYTIYLIDHSENTLIDLTKSVYHFTTNQADNSGRFDLLLSPNTILGTPQKDQKKLIVYSQDHLLKIKSEVPIENASINIYSFSGALLASFEQVSIGQKAWSASFNETGLFLLTIKSEDRLITQKFVKD